MMDLNRGDIIGINLNPKKGDEIGKVRPCIVISDNESNSILNTIMVMPLSTKLMDNMAPFRVRLKKRGDLVHDSDVLINHMRAISKKRVTSYISKVTDEEYKKIIENLCKNF
jgi:mRNA interferase MazF